MDSVDISPSPFVLPMLHKGQLHQGVLCRATVACLNCTTHDCSLDTNPLPVHRACPKGVAYVPATPGWTFVGFFWKSWTPTHPYGREVQQAYKRGRRESPASVLPEEVELRVLAGLPGTMVNPEPITDLLEQLGEASRSQVIQAIEESAKQTWRVALNDFALVATHDLLQIVSAIYQNAQFSLASRYGDVTSAVGQALPREQPLSQPVRIQVWEREKAVFYLCELAETRLTLTRDAGILDDGGSVDLVSLHGATVKILRPYRELARQRRIELNEVGTCFAKIRANYESLPAALLAIIDNAVKYAPPSTQVLVEFEESSTRAEVSVQSLGPRIGVDEHDAIFRPGVRGRHVRGVDGSGIGLWLAKMVVERSEGTISFKQDSNDGVMHRGSFQTRFTLSWPRAR